MKWVKTTDDLKTLWHAVEDIVDDKIDTVTTIANAVTDAYNVLTEEGVLGAGGYLVNAAENSLTHLGKFPYTLYQCHIHFHIENNLYPMNV